MLYSHPHRSSHFTRYMPHIAHHTLVAEAPHSASGSELRATFIKGKAQGQGLYTYNDGSRYVGQFAKSQRDGTGIYKSVIATRVDGLPQQGTELLCL
jgi:hypothetical protein